MMKTACGVSMNMAVLGSTDSISLDALPAGSAHSSAMEASAEDGLQR